MRLKASRRHQVLLRTNNSSQQAARCCGKVKSVIILFSPFHSLADKPFSDTDGPCVWPISNNSQRDNLCSPLHPIAPDELKSERKVYGNSSELSPKLEPRNKQSSRHTSTPAVVDYPALPGPQLCVCVFVCHLLGKARKTNILTCTWSDALMLIGQSKRPTSQRHSGYRLRKWIVNKRLNGDDYLIRS